MASEIFFRLQQYSLPIELDKFKKKIHNQQPNQLICWIAS